jgi:hypothetical protein
MAQRHNFRITADNLGAGGAKAKFRANMDAINLLHDLEFDGRLATTEEQEVLSRYVGWGSLDAAFKEHKTDQPETDKAAQSAAKEQPENLTPARNGNEHPSEPRSETLSKSAEDTRATKKPKSVHDFLQERTQSATKKRQENVPDRAEPDVKKIPAENTQAPTAAKSRQEKIQEKGAWLICLKTMTTS